MVLMLRQVRAASESGRGRAGGRWVSTVRGDSFRASGNEDDETTWVATKLSEEGEPGERGV